MRLEQLKYLVATAKAGSISAAAQRLNVSRQAVSSALGSLEAELGFSLFSKGSRGVEPTLDGASRNRKGRGGSGAAPGITCRGWSPGRGGTFGLHDAPDFALSDEHDFSSLSGTLSEYQRLASKCVSAQCGAGTGNGNIAHGCHQNVGGNENSGAGS